LKKKSSKFQARIKHFHERKKEGNRNWSAHNVRSKKGREGTATETYYYARRRKKQTMSNTLK